MSQTRDALLSSPRAKLARADEHLRELYADLDRWEEIQPMRIVRECHADGREHVFRLVFDSPLPLWRWGLLMGDALHNMRSALDNVVYALAIDHTGIDPPDDDARLAFPITTDPAKFAGVKWRIRSLSDLAQAAVERTQPYHRVQNGVWEPLWWLSQLNDVDKHRLTPISPVAAHPDGVPVVGAKPGTFRLRWKPGVYVHGTPVLWLSLDEPDPNVYVDINLTGAPCIKVEGQRPIGLMLSLRSIRREVGIVLRYLSLFVGQDSGPYTVKG